MVRESRKPDANSDRARTPRVIADHPGWFGPLAAALVSALLAPPAVADNDRAVNCPEALVPPSNVAFDEVYRGMPFQSGERASYTISYIGMLAGLIVLEVAPPRENQGRWYRVFRGRAQTENWFKRIYKGQGSLLVLSRPSDFGIRKSSVEQEKRALFSRRKTKQSVLDFRQEQCKVIGYTRRSGKPEQKKEGALFYGAMDVLSVLYFLRTQRFEIGKPMRIPIYDSDKNLWLHVNPLSTEMLTVPAGTFAAVKLKLRRYLGDKPLGKRGMDLWIASAHPSRPVLRLDTRRISMRLQEFVPGRQVQSDTVWVP